MANILLTYEGDIATVSILKDMLRDMDDQNRRFIFVRNTDLIPEDINAADTVIFIRPTSWLAAYLARKAEEAGCRIYTFLDDDLLNYRPITPWRLKGLKGTLEASEGLISFSRYLLGKYEKQYPHLKTIHIDMTVHEIIRRDGKEEGPELKIVYAASRDHAELFEQYVSEALLRISNQYPGKTSITFVGCKPVFNADERKIKTEYVAAMPLEKYREYMRGANFDIGLAPLRDTEFSRCKYYNKFVEYSMYGICGIYSDVEPYSGVITPELGMKAENTTEGWFGSIEKIIMQKELRDRIRHGIYSFLQENNSQESFRDKLEKWLSGQKKEKEKKTGCSGLRFGKIVYFFSRLPDKVYFFVFYVKNGQLKNRL